MQQYQCVKQPKDFNKNIYRRIFGYMHENIICLTSHPPQYKTNIALYCEDLDCYISIEKEEFEKCFVKYPYETNTKKEKLEMDKVQQHKKLCDQLNKTYEEKNRNYGDSFSISVQKYGLVAALTRISDKFNRLETLILNRSDGTKDESLEDTLIDLSGYCLMTVMELQRQQNKPYEKPEAHVVQDVVQGSAEDLEDLFKQSTTLKY